MATVAETLAITPEDIEAVKKLPSRYTNRLYVKVEGGNVRLNFGELVEGSPLYHTALILAPADALAFADMIRRIAGTSMPQTLPPFPPLGSGNVR